MFTDFSLAPNRNETKVEINGPYGVHDTLRQGFKSVRKEFTAGHPLEPVLSSTENKIKLSMMRNNYGLHMPLRHIMEQKIVGMPKRLPVLKSSSIAMDTLLGKDETIDVEDFMGGKIIGVFYTRC
ncbi:Proteasome maturation factor UMP1 domain-containing protein [Rozella allomycis CSF55]|uniref:Proteasome maturation factor UMP1 domain-containing protein n=1 Tax=Rozella allomycis (strain CSF55) TaxID=988480 RepID=A0A075B1B0_ROZAC|nr:Proteasome maturation factor UMP1 domain-containing protein [Rozella allomycis CSF55]|eukprot:EPZ34751.1 Proteasome maturation factor UMP1 domain-containing protein [Rozella allomycis CSF55]